MRRSTAALAAALCLLACNEADTASFDPDPASYETQAWPVGQSGQERVVAAVDSAFFGSAPAYLGRTFVSADRAGRDVAVLSHRFWSEALAADPSVIGTPLEVGGTPRIVIGVMAPGIDIPPDVALWIPRRR